MARRRRSKASSPREGGAGTRPVGAEPEAAASLEAGTVGPVAAEAPAELAAAVPAGGDRAPRGRITQVVRRSLLALSLLSLFVLPLGELALAAERGGGAARVPADGPGHAIAEAVPALARLGEVLSGSLWWLTIAGLEIADPLAVALATAGGAGAALLLAAVVPVAATLVLGRVFCGWLCPARLPVELAAWIRRRVGRRGAILVPRLHWAKYGVLVAGLALAGLTGYGLLALVYPPAVLVREAHYLLVYGLAGWGGVVVGGAFVLDVLVERGAWCRGLCPGGALYAFLAAPAPLRMRVEAARCTRCGRCEKVCPLGLDPTAAPAGECDRCGLCQRQCRDDALGYALVVPFAGRRPVGKGRRHGRREPA